MPGSGFSPYFATDLCNLEPVSFPLNLSLFICKMKGLEVLSALSFCAMEFDFYIQKLYITFKRSKHTYFLYGGDIFITRIPSPQKH